MAIVEIKKKTVKGVTWTVISQVSRMLITIVVMAILARLLDPSDFGLAAMVTVFTTFFAMFNDIGLSSAIIQKREVSEVQLSTMFWINLFEGFLITIIFFVFAPLIALLYSEEALKAIVMVISGLFTVVSFGTIQQALFTRDMEFRTLAIIEVTGVFVAGVVAIVMAFLGFGVWSIVAQMLTQSFVIAVLLFSLSKWKPKMVFKWKPILPFLGFGLPVMGFSFVNYLSRNVDNMIIGKYLGPAQLGYYDVAYKSLLFPLHNVTKVIGRVMFPALSHMEGNKERVRSAYIRATRYIALITFPLTTAIAVLAPQVVRVVLGSKWERAIFLMQVLAGISGLQSIYVTYNWIYLSQGRTGALFVYGFVSAAVFISSFIIGLHWQVEGVAVAYAIAFLLMLWPALAIPFRYIEMKFSYFLKHFVSIVTATLSMAVIIMGLRLLFEHVICIGDLPILIVASVIGLIWYICILWLMDRDLLKGLLEIGRDVISKNQESEVKNNI